MAADEPGLFDEDDFRIPEPSAGVRRTQRQAQTIEGGFHPLSGPTGLIIPLHPAASRSIVDRDDDGTPRCGSCAHRRTSTYPKCVYRDPEHPHRTRATRGEATDCRAWWPGCADYTPKDADQ